MRTLLLTAWALGLGSLAPWPARASLGGDAASIAADAVNLQARPRTTPRRSYDLAAISADSGVEVREYLSRDGVVFAVAWSGPAVPDLTRLLGGHFAEYASVLTAFSHPGLRRSVAVRAASGMVVEAGGHLRAYVGRAYLPALVPADVDIDELR